MTQPDDKPEIASAEGSELDDWTRRLTAELGVDIEVPQQQLLDLARVAAHEITRPAAPITTFLLGYAAAQRGGGIDALEQVLAATQSVLDDYL